jgi:plastocyanin
MAQRYQIGLLAGAAALLLMAPTGARAWPIGGPNIYDYTGVLLPGASIQPQIPNTWITPNYVYDYQVPRVVYVPVPVAPQLPAFERVQLASIQLQHGSTPADVRVRAGTVVTWRNGENQDQTLVVAPSPTIAPGGSGSSPRWRVPARASLSLVFHQPGNYDYYLLDAADQRAHLIVTE